MEEPKEAFVCEAMGDDGRWQTTAAWLTYVQATADAIKHRDADGLTTRVRRYLPAEEVEKALKAAREAIHKGGCNCSEDWWYRKTKPTRHKAGCPQTALRLIEPLLGKEEK